MKKIELLAPAGNMEKLKTAVYFGCDAVYLAYKQFGLRAYADNFDAEQLKKAVEYNRNLHRAVEPLFAVYHTILLFVNQI